MSLRRIARAFWWNVRVLVIALCAVATPAIAFGVALSLWLFVLLPGAVPPPRDLPSYSPTVVLSSSGEWLGTIENFDLALPMERADVNEAVTNAVISNEDRRFFTHTGVDFWGILRALRANAAGDRQGASTITQQLVKLRYLNADPTVDRKLREAIIAQQLERSMTKQDILFEYLSSAYFGSGATGLKAAAHRYFRIPPSELSLSQAAYLAGVLPSPTEYSFHTNPEAAEKARLRSLNSILEAGLASQAAVDEVRTAPLWPVDVFGTPAPGHPEQFTAVYPLPQQSISSFYPEIVSLVEEYLLNKYGPTATSQGFTVTTTIDIPTQQAAQRAVDAAIAGAPNPSVAAALAAVDPSSGFVRALADTNDFTVSQVNLATGGSTGFQVGSTAKAFVVAAALESGLYVPSSPLEAPASYTTNSGDVVRNFGGGSGGSVTLRSATQQSWNTTFVALAERLGPNEVAALARRIGISSWGEEVEFGPSVALGAYETSPLEMASSFGTFANNGDRFPPILVQRITTLDGSVVEDNTVRTPESVLAPPVAQNVTSILEDVVKSGTGTAARINRPVAGKTGTAENFSSAWFVGYTPQLSTAVWLGHSDGVRPLPAFGGVSGQVGGGIPARTFSNFMSTALKDVPPSPFPAPAPLRPGPPLLPSSLLPTPPPPPPESPTVNSPLPRQYPIGTPDG